MELRRARVGLAPGRAAVVGLALAAALGCQATPPASRVATPAGIVRAAESFRAEELAEALGDLSPRVAALLPGARPRTVDVWVQEEPRLYRFGRPAHQEADGFWAVGPGRIHLRADADDLRRTLAHELTHAFLGGAWDTLPGTLEEGLCDLLSVLAVPEGALRMRTGRLSAAAFCLGGLPLRIEIALPRAAGGQGQGQGLDLALGATVVLEGDLDAPLWPSQVFRARAGLSTARMEPARKKALYGLAFLVVERAVERIGLDGLHGLCLRAEAEGLASLPEEWLLTAADLPADEPAAWRALIEAELGPEELLELVAMYPDFLVSTVQKLVPAWETFDSLSVRLSVGPGSPPLRLVLLPAAMGDPANAWRTAPLAAAAVR